MFAPLARQCQAAQTLGSSLALSVEGRRAVSADGLAVSVIEIEVLT